MTPTHSDWHMYIVHTEERWFELLKILFLLCMADAKIINDSILPSFFPKLNWPLAEPQHDFCIKRKIVGDELRALICLFTLGKNARHARSFDTKNTLKKYVFSVKKSMLKVSQVLTLKVDNIFAYSFTKTQQAKKAFSKVTIVLQMHHYQQNALIVKFDKSKYFSIPFCLFQFSDISCVFLGHCSKMAILGYFRRQLPERPINPRPLQSYWEAPPPPLTIYYTTDRHKKCSQNTSMIYNKNRMARERKRLRIGHRGLRIRDTCSCRSF